MKGKRRLSGVLLIVAALIIMQLPVSEADAATSASDFKMEGSTLVKYRGTETNVSVPDTVEIIGKSAFEDMDQVELVVLPNSVERVEAYAFWDCDNLDTVVLGKGLLEVGDYAFANCKGLEQMTIPSNVRAIGIGAFTDCVNMTDITIPPEVTSIHDTAFDGCARLTIHCQTGSYADKYAAAFYEKQKEMPEYEDVPDYSPSGNAQDSSVADEPETKETDNSVGNESIDSDTDSSSGGKNTDGDGTVTTAGTGSGNLLGETRIVGNRAVVFIDNTGPRVREGSEEPENGETLAAADGTAADQTMAARLQEAADGSLPKYTIVDGAVVADQAYYGNGELTRVTLPQGIREIGQFAFARSSLTGVEIPAGTETICYGAFYHCDHLSEVSLPETVNLVEPRAFDHTQWVDSFLENGPGDFLVSGGVLVAYRGNSASVTVPESLQVIGEGAFEGCGKLAEVRMGTGVRAVKDRAFAGCALREIVLPDSVEELGLNAFGAETAVTSEGGGTPASTYETSAQRLSNEEYRMTPAQESGMPGVTVVGASPAAASLEGAKQSYLLELSDADRTALEAAYDRCYGEMLPERTFVYELKLTDDSGIPLTKLGKQNLTVTLPVPEALAGEEIRAVALDRNGQLVAVETERVTLDGQDAFTFQTTQPSLLGIYGTGSSLDEGEVQEMSASFRNMSEGPQDAVQESDVFRILNLLKWALGGGLLLWGSCIILRKR